MNTKGFSTARELGIKHNLSPSIIHKECNKYKVDYKMVHSTKYYVLEDFYSKVKHYRIVADAKTEMPESKAVEKFIERHNSIDELKQKKLFYEVKKAELEYQAAQKQYIAWEEIEKFALEFGLAIKEFWESHANIISRDIAVEMKYNEKELQKVNIILERTIEKFLNLQADYLENYKKIK